MADPNLSRAANKFRVIAIEVVSNVSYAPKVRVNRFLPSRLQSSELRHNPTPLDPVSAGYHYAFVFTYES